MKSNRFQEIIVKRYSDKNFSRKYYSNSKNGLKDYEEELVNIFLKNAKSVLVIGCGCGRETVALASRFKVTSIDLVPEMVEQTKRLCKEKNVKAKVRVMDASELKFEPESFDAVLLLNCVIDQIPTHEKRKRVVDEVNRVLNEEGICIVVSNNALHPGKKLKYWKEHVKELFKYLKERKGKEFWDRVYEEKPPVYVHLSTPMYIRKLFRTKFKTILLSSDGRILQKSVKNAYKKYFDPVLILVLRKK